MQIPNPLPNEAYAAFIKRAHAETIASIPDADARNQAVWHAWDKASGDTLATHVEAKFSGFIKRPNVCVFVENDTETHNSTGDLVTIHYGLDELADVANENNERMAERDSYPNIIEAHTPQLSRPGSVKQQPTTLGYAGPLKIGMIGRKQPVFGLFADEYYRPEKAERVKDVPNRSVEMIRLGANGRRYIGGIAAISEASRLPIPSQFSADLVEAYYSISFDPQAERYSMFTVPGGNNVHVPSTEPPTATSYGQGEAVGDDVVAKIVEAIGNTKPFQFLGALMQACGGDPSKCIGSQSAAPAPQQPVAPDPQQPQFGLPSRYSANQEDEDVVTTEQYNALREETSQMLGEIETLQYQVAHYAAEAADSERRRKLGDLKSRYPNIDLEAELEACLYSSGSELNDEQFNDRLGLMDRILSTSPQLTPPLPRGELPQTVESHQYSAAEVAMSRRVFHEHYDNTGERLTVRESREKAREILSAQ